MSEMTNWQNWNLIELKKFGSRSSFLKHYVIFLWHPQKPNSVMVGRAISTKVLFLSFTLPDGFSITLTI